MERDIFGNIIKVNKKKKANRMSTKTAEIRTRVEPKLKKESNKIFKKLGLSESEGVRLLLKGLVIHKGIPFAFKIPNEETIKAMEEVEKGVYSKGYNDVDEMFEDIINEKASPDK